MGTVYRISILSKEDSVLRDKLERLGFSTFIFDRLKNTLTNPNDIEVIDIDTHKVIERLNFDNINVDKCFAYIYNGDANTDIWTIILAVKEHNDTVLRCGIEIENSPGWNI